MLKLAISLLVLVGALSNVNASNNKQQRGSSAGLLAAEMIYQPSITFSAAPATTTPQTPNKKLNKTPLDLSAFIAAASAVGSLAPVTSGKAASASCSLTTANSTILSLNSETLCTTTINALITAALGANGQRVGKKAELKK